ncbi:MAG: hypothetical protein JSS89_09905 [Bacteroidetes bacterium]|nr:hypothetical protein [Bacteroidota bacterium]
MNNNTEIFDIMDRYLDRATTPDEERELFSTLLRDEELSTEFQAQSQVRAAMDNDVSATIVPPDLYASIVESAQQASLLPIPLVGAASLATEWVVRSVMALATATTAVVATVGTALLISVPPSIPVGPTSTVAAVPSAPQRSAIPAPMADKGTTHEQREQREQRNAQHDVQQVPTEGVAAEEIETIGMSPMLAVDAIPVVASTSTTTSTMASTIEESDPLQPLSRPSALQLRLTQTPLTYHMYATHADLTSAPNLGLEAEYALDREHAIGAILHNDVFPVGVVSSDGSVQQQYAMLWGGASYRYTPQWNIPLGLRPFAQLNLGGSSRGVVAQPTLGLQLHVNQFTISAGANMMTLFYQNNGTWNAASRVGMLVGIGFHL